MPVYDGGKNNVNQGDERVVYYWLPGDIDYEGNPNVQFCGLMTHVGAPAGGFLLCQSESTAGNSTGLRI